MSERLRTLRRITAVQKTLSDIADVRLAAAERARGEATAACTALDAFVADHHPTGAFATLAGRTAGRLAERAAQADEAGKAAVAAKVATATRLKLAERVVEAMAREERDADERRRLEELMDAAVAAAVIRGETRG